MTNYSYIKPSNVSRGGIKTNPKPPRPNIPPKGVNPPRLNITPIGLNKLTIFIENNSYYNFIDSFLNQESLEFSNLYNKTEILSLWEYCCTNFPQIPKKESFNLFSEIVYKIQLIKEKHYVIIDDPETYIDLNNQIKVARIIVKMVNAGLNIVIKTHSDFIIKELNNLIMLSNVKEKEKVLAENGYTDNEVLNIKDITAYYIEHTSIEKMKIDKYGIDCPNLDKVIEDLNITASNISSAL